MNITFESLIIVATFSAISLLKALSKSIAAPIADAVS